MQQLPTLQDAYDHLVERLCARRAAFAVGEEQVGCPNKRMRERGDVGSLSDATECLFHGQVRGDRHGPFHDHWEAGGPRPTQPGAQAVAGDDQRRYRYREGAEQRAQRVDEVAGNDARAGGLAKRSHWTVEQGDPIEYELGEEGIEVGEVAVHHALCHARFRGDGAARQPAHTLSP